MTSTPRKRGFKQLDVFTSVPYLGNPLAVVLDGTDLSTEQMRQFANWTNLSETTFILPPTNEKADYRVRIFTPTSELPFAGHPTLGTCRAFLDLNPSFSKTTIIQECALGLISIRLDPTTSRLSFSAPDFVKSGPISSEVLRRACSAISISPEEVLDSQWIVNGPTWFMLVLKDASRVKEIHFDNSGYGKGEILEDGEGFFGLVGAYEKGKKLFGEKGLLKDDDDDDDDDEQKGDDQIEPHFEIRAFVKDEFEDPVTGSFNAGVAKYLIENGLAPSKYLAHQGTNLGRKGRIYVEKQDDSGVIWVGGDVVTCIEGEVFI